MSQPNFLSGGPIPTNFDSSWVQGERLLGFILDNGWVWGGQAGAPPSGGGYLLDEDGSFITDEGSKILDS